MIEDKDPRINWELGWKAIMHEVKWIQKDKDKANRDCVRPEDGLFKLCLATSDQIVLDNLQRMRELEVEVRRRERMNAHLWRLCSKST